MTRSEKEYGGFLPLELNPGEEWFEECRSQMIRFNSVKASLYYLLRESGVRKVFLPYYYCPSTVEAVKKTGKEVVFYHIGQDLLPLEIWDEEDTAVLLVNYYGILDKKIIELAGVFRSATVIVDNAHAFFCRPLIKEKVYNLYSAKKFFGVPDGAYLIGKEVQGEKQEEFYSSVYAGYLLTAYEKGTNAAYGQKKNSDVFIAGRYAGMSMLSLGLLKNVEYSRVRNRRRDNFMLFHEMLFKINELEIKESYPAYHYPMLIGKIGSKLKNRLVEKKIYVPSLWLSENLMEEGNSFEKNMSENAVFLPIDQRYDAKDIAYMAEKVREIIK